MAEIYFRPKKEKIIETILYIAHRVKSIDHYHVLKIIYLADQAHVAKYGRPITFDNFCALPFGPVPSLTYDLIKKAEMNGLPFTTKKIGNKIIIDKLMRECNMDYLSESDIEVIDDSISKYSKFSFNELKSLTHKDKAWKEAWDAKDKDKSSTPIPFERIIPRVKGRKELVEDLEVVCQYI